jgi:hypothetical protein
MNPFLLVFIPALPAMLVLNIYILGRRMRNPESMITMKQPPLPSQVQRALVQHELWLTTASFEFVTSFSFGTIFSVVYRQSVQPRFLSFHFQQNSQRPLFDLETYFEDGAILDTETSGMSGLYPRPGAYAQGFPQCSLEYIWTRHLEAEAYLIGRFNLVPRAVTRPYTEELCRAMRVRVEYNLSQSFWPCRVLYRYFTTMRLRRNKSVMELYH